MTNIFDAAKVILTKKGSMPTRKLQKLLYYAQAWSLAWDDEELFPEDFEAWATGPINPALYDVLDEYAIVGASDIPASVLSGNSFPVNQDETITLVVDDYGQQDADWLSELTHMERPWKEARTGYFPGQYCHVIIPKASMQSYYGSL